ncbi:MAG: hypothetical protein V7609_2088 [Verrucomicrobiota bacterium]
MSQVKGYVGLDVGQRRVPVYFGVFALDNFALQQYVENTIDAPPLLSLRATPGARILQDGKIVGVWLELNGEPDTTNYVLRWVLVG